MTGDTSARAPFRARAAISAVFFTNGVVFASWIAHIPAVKAQHHLGDGELGLVLLSTAIGSVLALPVAAWLIARWGSRVMTSRGRPSASASCSLCPSSVRTWPLVAHRAGPLWRLQRDARRAMNAQAVCSRSRSRRPIMSSFHGLWSLGGLGGRLAAGIAAMALGRRRGHPCGRRHDRVGAVVVVALRRPSAGGRTPGTCRPLSSWKPPPALLGLGLVAFCGLLAEGLIGDWSAVYLRDALRVPHRPRRPRDSRRSRS